MLTRRGFLGTLAAVAASRVGPVPVAAAAAVPICAVKFVGWTECVWRYEQHADGLYGWSREPRRDDGDTILELR
jgi:hypothetical protein